jgi:chaperone required for assembly of F1-ATPase
MKRFWTNAVVEPARGGWHVTLDGKPVRIPGGPELELPTEALAAAVAAEWQGAGGGEAGGEISYEELPLTRIAGTGQHRIAPDPEPVVLEIARYGESDLLCYRAPHPPELAARQAALWQPWLDWAAETYGARLRVTSGVIHVPQEAEALAALAGAVSAQPPLALAALGVAVPALGSLVLGLALAAGALDAAMAHALATLDERYQEEFWGVDAEAAARRERIGADIAAAARVLALLRA